MTKLVRILAITLVVGLVLIAACIAISCLGTTASKAISFTVVEEGYSLRHPTGLPGKEPDPHLIIIASSDDLNLPAGLTFGEGLAAKIRSIDLDQYFLMFVWRLRSPNEPIVKTISRQQDNIIVALRDLVVWPGNYILPGWTQPYEIVQVRKVGNWNRNIRFVLKYETQGIDVEQTHFIP